MSTYHPGTVRCGPPAPYPAVEGDPVNEQWWWDRLAKDPLIREALGLTYPKFRPPTPQERRQDQEWAQTKTPPTNTTNQTPPNSATTPTT